MMPLSKTNELNLIMNENAKLTVEHSGGDGWTILHGDMLNLMRSFESGVFDAVITDPPYASGGASQTAKNRTTNQKYSSMSPDKALPDFAGDQKDQRSWTNWCTEWLTEANRVCKPGAVLVVFIDWRMAPCLSDALQRADWQLMRDVVQICVPGGRILDPFAGAGTTVLASVLEGYEAVGIEITDAYYKLGSDRVRFALGARESEAEPVE